jgi:hypothetical protein
MNYFALSILFLAPITCTNRTPVMTLIMIVAVSIVASILGKPSVELRDTFFFSLMVLLSVTHVIEVFIQFLFNKPIGVVGKLSKIR